MENSNERRSNESLQTVVNLIPAKIKIHSNNIFNYLSSDGYNVVRFEVFMVVIKKYAIFWDVLPPSSGWKSVNQEKC
jgi:hypothetical protein